MHLIVIENWPKDLEIVPSAAGQTRVKEPCQYPGSEQIQALAQLEQIRAPVEKWVLVNLRIPELVLERDLPKGKLVLVELALQASLAVDTTFL